MADSWWDRVKDYAYKHAPGPVREWVDDSRAVARIRADMAERSEREQAFGEIENSKRWPHRDAGSPSRPSNVTQYDILEIAARQGVADWAIAQIQAQQARADEDLSLFRSTATGTTWAQEYAHGTGMREGRDEELLRKYAEAIRRPGEIEIIPPTPKPTESVQYVEERRFHDKHNPAAREPIDLNRVRDERQRSWNWDR